jgi:effector-binding domain-containing protein
VNTEPKIERRKKQYYAAIRMAVPIPFGKYLRPAYSEVQDWLEQKGVSSGPAIIRYLTTDMSKDLDIEVGFTVDKAIKGNDRIITDFLPAGNYATLLYTGSYKGKGVYKANVALIEWAQVNKIKWSITKKKGIEWWDGRVEIYLTDPAKEKDPKKYKTELAFMVK